MQLFYEVRPLCCISLAVSRHVVASKLNLILTSYINLQESKAVSLGKSPVDYFIKGMNQRFQEKVKLVRGFAS